ncbi:MAG: hypothetical protein ACLPSH_18475 [Vulcanimicrobiaceae bacterium]
MLRRLGSVGLMLAFAFGALLVACGHQVTPSPSTSNLSGYMVVRFRTTQAMDFNNYNYVIVFNTCGVGGEPYPNAYATTFLNYSYSFVLGASTGGAAAYPLLYQYVVTPGTTNPPNPITVPLGASTTQLVLNDNGQGNEFELTFLRAQLNNPLQVSNPCPNGTPAPSASAGASPTASASPSPSPSPSVSPSAGTSPTPSTVPSGITEFWYVNFFTLDKTGRVQDSLGVGGATDNTYVLQVDTYATGTYVLTRPAGALLPSNPAAAIAGGEIDNYP